MITETLISLGYPRLAVERAIRQIPANVEDTESRTLHAIHALSSVHKRGA